MKTKHTPGPWHIEEHNQKDRHNIGIVSEDEKGNAWVICSMNRIKNPLWNESITELDRANAIRIRDCVNACEGMDDPGETVPEMLEVLKELIKALDNCPGNFNYSPLIEDKARLIIAKAEGGRENGENCKTK